ncbi:MAG: hypothetical protein V1742_11635 [Pseudomonadota bacterium]
MSPGKLRIRLKYCGGCNPEIDRAALVERLLEEADRDGVKLELSADEHADFLLLVNGCPHACLEEAHRTSPTGLPCLSIQGPRLEYQEIGEEEMPGSVWEKIKSRFENG